MTARRGFGDETWRLAVEGDVDALTRAAELLVAGELEYDGHRARAFALAVGDRVDDALAQLNEGWTEEWPFPAAYAADIARVRYLAGDYEQALDALHLSVRGAERLDAAVAELLCACVRRARRLKPRGVKVAFAGGTPWQRVATAAAVIRAS